MFGRSTSFESDKDFLEQARDAYFYADFPVNRHSLWRFDPLLFLYQITSAIAYKRDDSIAAVQILAYSAGDSDTVPMVLATVLGAWLGQARLTESLGAELVTVEDTLSTVFGVNLGQYAATYVRASQLSVCER